MSDKLWAIEHFVKITPRRKGDYGFCSIGNDYNNFDDAEQRNAYYKKQCEQIISSLREHYRDYDIASIEYATNESELDLENELENRVDEYETRIDGLRAKLDRAIRCLTEIKEICAKNGRWLPYAKINMALKDIQED